MFGISPLELVILIVVIAVALFILFNRKQRAPIAPNLGSSSVPRQPQAADISESSADVVARLTQRFCPRCRAPLAADAPEGLCPACLMAGGIGSAAAVDPESGMAATTPPSGSKPPTAGEWENLGQHFLQLELLELLGRGGMGAVYKARQKNLDRVVALKVIPPEAAKDPTFAERFAREARALARLNHPNIVTVYDFGQSGDVFFLLMEYVDGVNLRHAQQANRLAPSEALAIVPQICDALQYAHDQGVVHRDIKPENILLDRSGRVKIADFGLAKMLGKGPDNYTLTGTQQIMGTPRYMAPEQIERPSTVDHRADIFSLGVVFYEMLTGELPIGRFQPPSQKVQVDVRIDDVVLRALEKEPDRRYQRASQVKVELASASQPSWQTPAPAVKQFGPPSQGELSLELIRRRVRGPAIGLFGAGVVGMLPLLAMMLRPVGMTQFSMGQIEVAVIAAVLCLIPAVVLIGAWQMWQVKNYGLAVAASVLAVLPFSLGWIIGLPTGIWALVVLLDPKVRTAFNERENSPTNDAHRDAIPPLGALITALGAAGAWLRHLSRSRHDQWLGGVCGGLGVNTPFPAWCWRILFIVLIFGYGIGVIAYIVLWICLPESEEQSAPPPTLGPVTDWLREMSCSRKNRFLGGVCGGLGEHTPIPAWVWRVLFLMSILSYGVGLIPYVLLWICLPEASKSAGHQHASPADNRPSWHTPAPARKPNTVGSGSDWKTATVIAAFTVCVGVGMLMFAAGMVYLALRSGREMEATIASQAVDAERPVTVNLTPEEPERDAASTSDFDRMLKSLRAESHDDGKLSFIKLISRENRFTSDESRQLLQSFSFDSDREKAAAVLYPGITDRKDFYLILEPFVHDTGRTALLKRLKLDGPVKPQSVQAGVAIFPEEAQRMLSSLKTCSHDEGKLAFIKAIAYERTITSDQARRLLQVFSFDSDRERAALDVYPRLSDPQNFYRVLEVFSFDSGRQAVRKKLKLD